ncbi:E3 ubiquitin-protein ligase UHRF1-like [Dermacentor variabilis]|uniref:E3 ubiquitin-protein ligase UHRF1-like n=1 Tax=Dermacentor variabilis TaxID=34621 RepID=UPI003F5C9090
MWIQVRTMDGGKSVRIDGLSKITKVEELRLRVRDEFDVETALQRLFYRGKQLEDGYTLFDYDVGLNDIIQLLVRVVPSDSTSTSSASSSTSLKENLKEPSKPPVGSPCFMQSLYYKVGDLVDARDLTNGAWFEAKVVKITQGGCTSTPADSGEETNVVNGCESESVLEASKPKTAESQLLPARSAANEPSVELKRADPTNAIADDGLLYHVQYDDYEDEVVALNLNCLRPRAKKVIPFVDVSIGDRLMVNFNVEEPSSLGFWYDCLVTSKKSTRTQKELWATIFIGASKTPLENCRLMFCDELFAIEPHPAVNAADRQNFEQSHVKRRRQPDCTHCGDRPERRCRHCACCRCGSKKEPERQLLCDECDRAFHLGCLEPPLEELPEEEHWFCPDCKHDPTEVVRPGEALKESRRKSRLPSIVGEGKRDWGRGMACVGRTRECTLVPANHFGALPNVPVGSLWKFRLQVSESGCHRPPVGGIHGRESDGAYSIVLSGGYEDDQDDGEQFLYTGSGGRDLSGNKRTAEQSCDQKLTRMNMSLARNCAAPINAKDGAEAKDWREGKPVRVIRSFKGRKHSKYCPEDGYRYDGVYKLVKYWPEKGKSGFLVWRYLLRRDDKSPAPWTAAGKLAAEKLGLCMQYPEGYLESQDGDANNSGSENDATAAKGKGKRSRASSGEDAATTTKKRRASSGQLGSSWALEASVRKTIEADKCNKRLWSECLAATSMGRVAFLDRVQAVFTCVCCQELVCHPVTTPCNHNLCQSCLQRSFKAEVFSCPTCRQELGNTYTLLVNKSLLKTLQALFPGYENGR